MADEQTSPAAPAGTPASAAQRQPATIRYVDRPDIPETFAELGQRSYL